MTTNELFTEQAAVMIWDRYFRRIDKIGHGLKPDTRHELVLEIQDHLHESFRQQDGDSEAERLLKAIEHFGEPEAAIGPLLADRLLTDASRTLNPRTIVVGLRQNMSRGMKAIALSTLFGLGYLLSLAMLLVAVLKPFQPDLVGLFAHQSGGYTLGILDDVPAGSTEIMGFWVIPFCLVLSVGLYLALTRLLRRLRTGGNPPTG